MTEQENVSANVAACSGMSMDHSAMHQLEKLLYALSITRSMKIKNFVTEQKRRPNQHCSMPCNVNDPLLCNAIRMPACICRLALTMQKHDFSRAGLLCGQLRLGCWYMRTIEVKLPGLSILKWLSPSHGWTLTSHEHFALLVCRVRSALGERQRAQRLLRVQPSCRGIDHVIGGRIFECCRLKPLLVAPSVFG